jgi:hypothetical protein
MAQLMPQWVRAFDFRFDKAAPTEANLRQMTTFHKSPEETISWLLQRNVDFVCPTYNHF